jgi:hydrogenase maturation protease
MGARVIALGQAAAGDDGVGLAVLEALRAAGVPADVELVRAPEDAALVGLLETPLPVVLLDAVLEDPPGRVIDVVPEAVAPRRTVSTHGLGVAQAIALARVVAPGRVSPSIRLVGITIARPARYAQALSPAVAAAVPAAVTRVRALVRG